SFVRLATIDWGFRPDHVLIVVADQRTYHRITSPQEESLFAQVLPNLRAIPGVLSVSVSLGSPIVEPRGGALVAVGDRTETPKMGIVSPDYFKTMGIKIIRGRGFTEGDDLLAPKVVVIDSRIATQFWPGQNPIGKTLQIRSLKKELWEEEKRTGKYPPTTLDSLELVPYQVVGEVVPVRNFGVRPWAESEQDFYVDYPQRPPGWGMPDTFLVHTSGPAYSLAKPARTVLEDPQFGLKVWNVDTLDQRVQGAIG